MDDVANECDLALTLASTLSTELLARELPIGIAAAFENQKQGHDKMVSSGVAVSIGNHLTSKNWEINRSVLEKLVSSSKFREQLRKKTVGLIELGGASRIVREILTL
ncbi:hypothetical protein MCEMRE249_00028 [Candidatus Nanopelagicaceae bacterium]